MDVVAQWIVFSDLHVSRTSLPTCLQVLEFVHNEATTRNAGVIFLGDFWHEKVRCVCLNCALDPRVVALQGSRASRLSHIQGCALRESAEGESKVIGVHGGDAQHAKDAVRHWLANPPTQMMRASSGVLCLAAAHAPRRCRTPTGIGALT